MKKLICAKDVEALLNDGKKTFYIEPGTIVTPSAKDIAKANDIIFSTECSTCSPDNPVIQNSESGLDSEMIYQVLKNLFDKGELTGILEGIVGKVPNAPYVSEVDTTTGLKVVRGNTVRMDVFDTGVSTNQVFYQELVGRNDKSPMSSGFLTLEKSKFDIDVLYDELYYVIEGTVTVSVNGKSFTAGEGDSFYLPNGAKITWSALGKAKLFYTTYPAL